MGKLLAIAALCILPALLTAQVKYASEGGKIKAVWVDNRELYSDSILTVQLLNVPFPIAQKIELMNDLSKIVCQPGENRFDLYINTTNRKLWKTN
jgi:hypothetical protein